MEFSIFWETMGIGIETSTLDFKKIDLISLEKW